MGLDRVSERTFVISDLHGETMAIWVECRPPFVWRPKIESHGPFHGLLWGWFRVAKIDGDINSFVQDIAKAGGDEREERLRATNGQDGVTP